MNEENPIKLKAEFMAPYYMGRRIKIEIKQEEKGSFSADRFLSGKINPWNQIAHESGFPTLAGALAGASRTIIAFSSGPVEIVTAGASLLVERELGRWHIIDQADGSPITSDSIFSDAIREALELAGGVKI